MVLHFETTITSWGEGGQAVLKQQLGSSFVDLKIIVNGINLLLINELQNYLIQFDEIKVQYSLDLRKPISQDLAAILFGSSQTNLSGFSRICHFIRFEKDLFSIQPFDRTTNSSFGRYENFHHYYGSSQQSQNSGTIV